MGIMHWCDHSSFHCSFLPVKFWGGDSFIQLGLGHLLSLKIRFSFSIPLDSDWAAPRYWLKLSALGCCLRILHPNSGGSPLRNVYMVDGASRSYPALFAKLLNQETYPSKSPALILRFWSSVVALVTLWRSVNPSVKAVSNSAQCMSSSMGTLLVWCWLWRWSICS